MVFGHGDIKQVKYIENKGQWNNNILYKANIPEGVVYLEDNLFTYSFYDSKKLEDIHHSSHNKEQQNEQNLNVDVFSFKVELLGGNKQAIKHGSEVLPEYHNYFIGNDQEKWKGKVPIYNVVNYTSIYNGIDLKVYSQNIFFKYDFIVAPNANTSDIQLQYNGVNPILKDDNLRIDIGFNTIIEQKPIAYQLIKGKRIEIDCEFKLSNNIVSFAFPNGYNEKYELIIDPILVTSTLSGTSVTNYGHTATYGNGGEIFTGAISFGTGYPTTIGAFQVNYGGGVTDIAISKLNPDGSSLLWATYIGGASSDYPHSMMVNGSNELYVYGSTDSYDYPTSLNAFQNTNAGSSDIIVTHLTQDGSNIIGSTYIGGSGDDGRNYIITNYGDPYRGEIIVDNSGNAYIASFSSSTDFPTTPGSFQPNNAGGQDGVVFKLNSTLDNLEWATYLGSSGDDAAYGLRLDDNDNAFVTGAASSGFPTTVGAAIPNYIGGSHDAFIAQLNPTGSNLIASSLFGSTDKDQSFFIDIDLLNDVYIYGQNASPVSITSGCYGVANSTQFIAKFNPDLTNIQWQTTIGSGGSGWGYDFIPIAFMVDVCKNIYLSGHAGWNNTIPSMYTTPNAFYTSGGFYLMALYPDATAVDFATYYAAADHVDGGTSRFDPSGKIYQGVCSGSGSQLITTPNAYSTTQSTSWDVGVFKIDFELINFAAAIASPGVSGCAPYTVNFINSSTGNQFFWDFDDNGQVSTVFSPTYTFNNTGTYDVVLIAIDSASCNIADTIIIQIDVLASNATSTSSATACDNYTWNGITYTQSGTYTHIVGTTACDSTAILNLIINIPTSSTTNTSSCVPITWNGQTYTSSGIYAYQTLNANGCDSTAILNLTINSFVTSTSNVTFCDAYTWNGQTYTSSGTYTYQTLNTNGCDSIATLNLIINSTTTSSIPIGSCVPITWNGQTYTSSGTYTYQTLNTNGCDSIATLNLIIIDIISISKEINTCYSYFWKVNSGTYTNSGTYIDTIHNTNACDTIVKLILEIENRIFLVPNSFTPNNDEHNELFRIVSTEEIEPDEYFEIRIFDRWGKNIYHSNDIETFWDGTLDGNFVQHGVYVWKIQYLCKDKIKTKIGTVTLIN